MSGNRIYFLLRLGDGRPWPKFAYDFEEVVSPVVQHCCSRLHRDPQAFLQVGPDLLGKPKVSRHDSDDRVGLARETDALAYDTLVRMESLPP